MQFKICLPVVMQLHLIESEKFFFQKVRHHIQSNIEKKIASKVLNSLGKILKEHGFLHPMIT